MSASGMLGRFQLRSRWPRIVVLIVLIGAVGAIILATVAGARRTSSALDRFRATSRSADVELAVLGRPTAAQLNTLDHAHDVTATAALLAYAVVVTGSPTLQAVGVPVDASFGTRVDRARVVAGRAVDPSAADEVTVGEALAAQLRLGVGDRLRVTSYSPAQIAAVLGGASDVGKLAGPSLDLRIVGVVRRPLDLSDRAEAGGFLALSPAFAHKYAGRIGVFGTYLRVRTRRGAADTAGVTAAARRIFGRSFLSTQALGIEAQGARDAIHVLTLALWAVAAVAALAGAVVIGIVLSRELLLMSVDNETLRALGMTRRRRVAMFGPFCALAIGGGVLVAAAGAIGASVFFPIGVARRAEPDLGVHPDWAFLVPVAALLTIGLIAIALVAATRAASVSARGRELDARRRASPVVIASARAGLYPTVTHGLRMALESGGEHKVLRVRSAFVGAVLGVLGITAVLVFSSSLNHLVETPRLYGWTWDFTTRDTTANTACGGTDFGLSRIHGIEDLAELCFQSVQVDGRATPASAFREVRGATIDPEVLAGRPPRGPREVALGSTTMRALHKKVGDSVRVRGRNATLEYDVVGRVVLPTVGVAQPLADGAVFTGAGFAPLFDQNLFSRYFVGRFAPGADPASVERHSAAITQLAPPAGPTVAVEVERVRQVDWFPAILGALLGGLGLVAIGHALVTTTRRRRGELALLKALGFRRRQIRETIAWQATTLATVGFLIGIPAGLAVGSLAWRAVAGSLGVASVVTLPPIALLTIPAALVFVNLIALFPERVAARTPPASILRSE